MEKYLKNKKTLSLILFLLYIGCILMVAQETAPRTYITFKALETLEIDGMDNESSWKKAPFSDTFIDIEGVKEPTYKTRMKMLWDDTYLYFFADMKEPHVWGTLKKRDTVIFYNNDFEIFIDPDGDTHNYMEFEMNALNTVWDLLLTKPYRNHGKVYDSWDIQGIKTAVHINGTLNDPSDTDEGWSVEIAIPWEVLMEANTHKNIPIKEFWRLGFSRVNWNFDLTDGTYSRKKDQNGKYLREYNWVWSPQWVINMHEPEKWGYVYFSHKTAGAEDTFEIPKEDHIKWHMYSLFRQLIQTKSEFNEEIAKIESVSREIQGETIRLSVEKHSTGWNLWTKNPFNGKKMIIREDGKFLQID